ncbi:MAG: dockerin type I repeat-containing protein [Candidatus Peregrinibacteria bacterium]|nr:dockerin type I repeat-containing protein [Candidatus Peregrinibacteria bacterium]
MHTYLHSLLSRTTLRAVVLGATCIVGSFVIGVQTVGELEPVEHGQATELQASIVSSQGDLDNDGAVDLSDIIALLEIAQGYAEATPAQLKADPNGDSQLTVEDALRLLRTLAIR